MKVTSSTSASRRAIRDAFPEARPNQIEYMDVSPKQVVSASRPR